jgi:hypothetical protein
VTRTAIKITRLERWVCETKLPPLATYWYNDSNPPKGQKASGEAVTLLLLSPANTWMRVTTRINPAKDTCTTRRKVR